MQVDLREFRAAYLAEVDEHLSAINAALMAVDAANRAKRASPRELRELMRLLHTIKGLSGMVGIDPIVSLAHRMETVLRTADSAGGLLDDRALEAMIAGTRAIELRVRAVARDEPVPEAAAGTLAELDAVETRVRDSDTPPLAEEALDLDPELAAKLSASEREQLAQGAAAGRRTVRVEFAPSPENTENGLTITSLRERLTTIGEIVRMLPSATAPSEVAPGGLLFTVILLTEASDAEVAHAAGLRLSSIEQLLAAHVVVPVSSPVHELDIPLSPSSPSSPPSSREDAAPDVAEVQRPGVLRVDVARIDDTIDKLAGLIVTRSRLVRAAAKLREGGADTRELEAIILDNTRQLRDLRAAILRVRMVPIAAVLDRLPLVIRGLGRTSGKSVRLLLVGGGAELDKTVAERIFPALVHLLRNAVDHGVELPEARRQAGKPEQATLTVSASTLSNRQIELRIEDDGGGVDRARVAAKAGRDVPADDETLLELLCRPGLSTRDDVDTTSGRGVGMDIVRKVVVDGLGGHLALESVAGAGTVFTIRVPLTIAIVDSLTLRCGAERFVVPVPVVEEIVEIDPAKIVRGPRSVGHAGQFFMRRGETVAVVDLAETLGIPSAPRAEGDALRQALVVRRGREEPIAFAIDRVLGRQETVVRPLLDPLVAVPGISGSTDLGDGRATLVLDLLGLSSLLGQRGSGQHERIES